MNIKFNALASNPLLNIFYPYIDGNSLIHMAPIYKRQSF